MKQRGTNSSLLRQLRSMNVVVFHPEDQDGQEVIGQLHRIGCRVQAFWPPLEKLPADVDVVFLAVRPEVLTLMTAYTGTSAASNSVGMGCG